MKAKGRKKEPMAEKEEDDEISTAEAQTTHPSVQMQLSDKKQK